MTVFVFRLGRLVVARVKAATLRVARRRLGMQFVRENLLFGPQAEDATARMTAAKAGKRPPAKRPRAQR